MSYSLVLRDAGLQQSWIRPTRTAALIDHVYENMKMPHEAETAYRKAIEPNPNFRGAYKRLANILAGDST